MFLLNLTQVGGSRGAEITLAPSLCKMAFTCWNVRPVTGSVSSLLNKSCRPILWSSMLISCRSISMSSISVSLLAWPTLLATGIRLMDLTCPAAVLLSSTSSWPTASL